MFNNSSHHNFAGVTTFNIVHGNQYNSFVQQETLPAEEWKMKLYREYERIPAWRIKIYTTIAESDTDVTGDDCANAGSGSQPNSKRVVHLVNLLDGKDDSQLFLSVAYTGSDAGKVFKRDFITYSRIRHANFVHFRGFNDSDIPMFIFQEELIPVDHVLERHIHSLRALQCYLSLQASTALKTTRQWHREEQPPYSCNNVWIQPRKGMIVIGPPGPRPIKYFDVEEDLGSGTQNPSLPPLPIGLYTTNALLPYLDEHASSNSILSILSALAKHNPEPIEDLPVHCQILAFPNRDPLVKCQSCWTYEAHHLGPSRNYLGQPTVMEDGRSRFTISCIPCHSDNFYFWFQLDPKGDSEPVWLSQACSIFSRCNIPKDKWSNYVFMNQWVYINLLPENIQEIKSLPDTPCHLFILPPPQRCDGYPNITTWMRGENLYYWSSDPAGGSIMPESQRLHLGLPSLAPSFLGFDLRSWSIDIYDTIWTWQEMKGFDPTTTEFARSLGFPVMELFPPILCEGRFEVLSGNTVPSFEAERRDEVVDMNFSPSSVDFLLDMDSSMVTENGSPRQDMDIAVDEWSAPREERERGHARAVYSTASKEKSFIDGYTDMEVD